MSHCFARRVHCSRWPVSARPVSSVCDYNIRSRSVPDCVRPCGPALVAMYRATDEIGRRCAVDDVLHYAMETGRVQAAVVRVYRSRFDVGGVARAAVAVGRWCSLFLAYLGQLVSVYPDWTASMVGALRRLDHDITLSIDLADCDLDLIHYHN